MALAIQYCDELNELISGFGLGMPLQLATSLTSSGSSKSAGTAAGFSMMQGESADEVTKMMQGHPHLKMPGSSIEVLEVLSPPGM